MLSAVDRHGRAVVACMGEQRGGDGFVWARVRMPLRAEAWTALSYGDDVFMEDARRCWIMWCE